MRPIRFLLTSRPAITGQVLGIVYRVITLHLVKKAGYSKKTTRAGAVTLIQRFGRPGAPGALNMNIHFHGAHPCAPPCGRPAVVQTGMNSAQSSITAVPILRTMLLP